MDETRLRGRARWLLTFGLAMVGGVLGLAGDAGAAAFNASASLTPRIYYINDAAGSVYTFTVTNTGSSSNVGAIEIRRPNTLWKVTSCPTGPTGWLKTAAVNKCRYRSASGSADDIKPGQSRTFSVKAWTVPGTMNHTGTWPIVVSNSNNFAAPSLLKFAAPTGTGLTAKLYTFQLTRVVVATGSKTPGSACPAANKTAIAASSKTVVVCGKNRASVALTPSSTYSSLGGTFVGTPGTFLSGAIPANSGDVVLADWNATAVTGVPGSGKTVLASIGSASNRTSSLRTFAHYVATNALPVANNDAYGVNEDTVLNVNAATGVLANDTDADGNALVANFPDDPPHGSLFLNPDGSFGYTPDANFHGTDTFTYVAQDPYGSSAPATVTITVASVNDLPSSAAVAVTAFEDEAKAITLAATDADGDSLTYSIVAAPTHGSLGTVTGSSVTYTPDDEYSGPDSFTYKANDGTGDSNTSTVSITVNPVNDPPVANGDAYSVDEDTVLTVLAGTGVLTNDTDEEGGSLTAIKVTDPAHGGVTLNADGSFTYTPDANFFGADSFTYRAGDGTSTSAPATVAITVDGVNDLPVAQDVTDSTNEDSPLAILLNASDPDGDPLTYEIVSSPSHGTTGTPSGLAVLYTPDANYFGSDTFTYRASDGTGFSNISTVVVTVNSVNDLPAATNDSYSINEDTPLLGNVLVNDTDVEGSALTATKVTDPAHGDVTLNSDGSFTYTPDADYFGADSFTYKANDGTGDSTAATVDITVNPVNDAPVAQTVTDSADEDTPNPVTLVATDADGDSLTYEIVSGPTNGSLGSVVGNAVTYTPDANYNGSDSFTYKASDGSLDSNTATVNLTVNAVNDAPVANDDTYSTNEDTPLLGNVLTNDTDVESSPLTAVKVTDPANGDVTLNADGSFTYTPDTNYNGSDSFTYKANDGGADSPAATVNITIDAVNDAPVASPVTDTTAEDTPKTITLVATDTEGSGLTYSIVSGPTHGSLGTVTGNTVDYTPDANYNGPDSFTYKATDAGSADSNAPTVDITVTPVDDPPVAVDDAYQAVIDTPKFVGAPGVLANDTEVDGETLTASNPSVPAHGELTFTTDGSFTYTPDSLYEGPDSFTYDVSDGHTTDTATVNITVAPPNEVPTADTTSGSGTEDGGDITITLTGHDADDDALTFTPGTATNGTVGTPTSIDCTPTNDCTASVTYTPDADFYGSDSFTYTVTDGTATSAPATANVTVDPINDEPSFTKGDDDTVNEDSGARTVTGWATNVSEGAANESAQDVTFHLSTDNDPLFSVAPAISPAGDLTYTPAVDANGSAVVTVYLDDDGGTANTGDDDTSPTQQFTITVTAVNDVPSFTKGGDETVFEDAGAQSVSNWAQAISKGPSDESGQTLTFLVTNDNNGLFSSQPAVSDTGTLTYTPTPDAVGSATVSVSLKDNGGTANFGDDTSDVQTFLITVNGVNDEPTATTAGDDTVLEDSGARTVNSFVVATSPGPSDEAAQNVTVSITGNDNNALFSAQPQITGTTLTYTPAANANGSAVVTVTVTDDGGTANSGDNTSTQTFTITVTPVNDVPTFTKGVDQNLDEDSGSQSVSGWVLAMSSGPANESSQTVQFLVTNNNNALFSTQPAVSPTGTLTFESTANLYGTATVSVAIKDNGGTANGGVDTSATQMFTITVNAVNDAPVAAAKAFTVQANMKISLGGLLTGATDPNDVVGNPSWVPTFTVGDITVGGSCIGCTVSNVNQAAGTFDFDPPAGGTGTFSVTYTVIDNGFPAPGAESAPQTITFTVNGPVIWFVDANAGVNGTGRLSAPFNVLASATTAMGTNTNQRIFVQDGNVTGNVTLQTNSWLISDVITGTSFDSVMGISPPSGTIARPSNGSATQRTLTGTVTLGDNSVARGFDLTPGTNAKGLVGSGADGVTVNTMSITTTGARAVDLVSSSGTISLKKVDATGADRGISLDGVNTSSGSFTITGSGSAASGGTITGSTSTGATGGGIYLNNSKTISLDRMVVTASTGSGIYGATVDTFTIANSTISNNGTDVNVDHSGVNFDNLTGTSSMNNLDVSGSIEHNIVVENSTGTANLTISNSQIHDNTPGIGGNGIYINSVVGGSAVMNFTGTSNTIEDNRITGLQLFSQGSGKMTANVSGGTYVHNGQGIDLGTKGSGGLAFTVTGGTVTGCACIATTTPGVFADTGVGVNVFKGDTGSGTGANALAGTITGMTINHGGSTNNAPGIWVHGGGGAGEVRASLTNNTISNVVANGILVQPGANNSGVNPGAQSFHMNITGNNVTTNAASFAEAINLQSGTTTGDTVFICANIASNTASAPDAGVGDIRVWSRYAGTTFRLPGYSGLATDLTAVQTFLKNQNTITDATAAIGNSGPGFVNGAACTAP